MRTLNVCGICGAITKGGDNCGKHASIMAPLPTSAAPWKPLNHNLTPMVLVAGAPCSGKTTFVHENAKPDDLILDSDELYRALNTSPGEQPEHLRPYVWSAFFAIVAEQRKQKNGGFTIWVIQCAPKREQRQRYKTMNNAEVVLLDTPEDVCVQRAIEDKRRLEDIDHIHQWFKDYEPDTRYIQTRVGGGQFISKP